MANKRSRRFPVQEKKLWIDNIMDYYRCSKEDAYRLYRNWSNTPQFKLLVEQHSKSLKVLS